MIIFRTADTMTEAINIAQVFDKHGLCVVSMSQVISNITHRELTTITWIIVGQGAEVDITLINEDIKNSDTGYSEEEPDGS